MAFLMAFPRFYKWKLLVSSRRHLSVARSSFFNNSSKVLRALPSTVLKIYAPVVNQTSSWWSRLKPILRTRTLLLWALCFSMVIMFVIFLFRKIMTICFPSAPPSPSETEHIDPPEAKRPASDPESEGEDSLTAENQDVYEDQGSASSEDYAYSSSEENVSAKELLQQNLSSFLSRTSFVRPERRTSSAVDRVDLAIDQVSEETTSTEQ